MTATPGSSAGRPAGKDPIDQLVSHARWRLAILTLMLVTALLVSVGIVTAVVATRQMHETIDTALDHAIETALVRGDEEDNEGTAGRIRSGWETFVTLLDATGDLLPGQVVPLAGMPDKDAVGAATVGGMDRRAAIFDGASVRLLTRAVTIPGHEGSPAVQGFAQAAYRMTLHDTQESILLWTITIVSVLGLIGAGLVTTLVTRRALGPIRSAFATERRFVAAASHELRTPVAIVRASAEILERESLVNDEGRPLVADIISEADRMGLLVTDLLTLASAEAGALRVERRPMELVRWLDGVVSRAETMAGAAALSLVVDLPTGRSVIVDADEDRLSQVLLILVDNAIQHSPTGSTITVRLSVTGNRATIGVLDQGPGVPAADRERIFEPFARLPDRRRTSSGSGLGLAIARQLAIRHGAELSVDDAPGGGARFTVRMPMVSGPAATSASTGRA